MKHDDGIQRNEVLCRLYIATILCCCFIVVEVAGGLISHSLAVLSDAAHLFSDLASFAVAIAASYLASLPATAQHTYGLKRSESLAALFSMVSLAFVSAGLSYEAVRRLIAPPETGVDGLVMTMIAGIGVVVNLILAWVLGGDHHHLPSHGHDHSHDHDDHHGHADDHHNQDDMHYTGHCHNIDHSSHARHDSNNHGTSFGHDHNHNHNHHADETTSLKALISDDHHHNEHHHDNHDDHDDDDDHHGPVEDTRNVNLRAAYLHVMSDLAQSVAVFVGGLCIWWKPQYHIIDPILTLLFCVLVLYNAFGVLRSSIAVLLEEIPTSVDWKKLYDAISKVPNVKDVHDLHVWSISHGQVALSVHCTSSDPDALYNITRVCNKFGIKHTTIQVQSMDGPCPSCQNDCCTSHLSN